MRSINYLGLAKERLNVKSGNVLAKRLGITQQAISLYESGKRTIDNYTAFKLAEILEIDPMEIIATAEAEREKDETKRDYWRKVLQKVATAALCIGLLPFPYNQLEAKEIDHSNDYAPRVKRHKVTRRRLSHQRRRHDDARAFA